MDCLFCKISNGEVDSNIIYEDDLAIAFDDLNPGAPHHKLIIPRKHIATINDIQPEDEHLVGHLFSIARIIAADLEIAEVGYRVVMNCNKASGQAIYHIHLHILGGRKLTWPPG